MKTHRQPSAAAPPDPEELPAATKPRAKKQRQKPAASEVLSGAAPEEAAQPDKPPGESPGRRSGKPRGTAAPRKAATRKSSAPSRAKKSRAAKKAARPPRHFILGALVVEAIALLLVGLATTVAALGYAAMRFSGLSLATNLLPFAAVILALIVACALLLTLWFFIRRWLLRWHPSLAAIVTLFLLAACVWAVRDPRFFVIYDQFRIMVGGKEEVARRQLAHQVYAAYRRIAPQDAEAMLAREKLYHNDIAAAASAYQLDADLLSGLAAVESSFLPRASADGGEGLFQITNVPKAVRDEIDRQLPPDGRQATADDHGKNALLGTATLAHYIRGMGGDVFLGLLAYNIGPKNGGLRSIMEQYGARDFVSIQPYLQYLPRDYPVKVFAWALLFRVVRTTGGPLPYQEGTNAARVQAIGIPGLDRR